MIRLNCFIETLPENRDMVIADATVLTQISRNEKGCRGYDIYASQTCPEVLMICETWEDQAALDAHQSTDSFKRYVGHMREIAKMKLERFDF